MSAEASAIREAIQASQPTADQKGQPGDVLQQAQGQGEAGDEAGCQATVDYVKVALGITTHPQE